MKRVIIYVTEVTVTPHEQSGVRSFVGGNAGVSYCLHQQIEESCIQCTGGDGDGNVFFNAIPQTIYTSKNRSIRAYPFIFSIATVASSTVSY